MSPTNSLLAPALCILAAACGPARAIELARDDAAGVLSASIDGREAFAYQYHGRFALPHVFPLRSPSGRPLTVQRAEPFPHHRSIWIADRVQLEGGPVIDYYHCTANLRDAERPELGFTSFIRHDTISDEDAAGFTAELTWIEGGGTPVLDQTLRFDLRDLGQGEYLLDLAWELRAAHGPATFRSDWVHYAWPYLRMDPAFSGESGGVLVDDQGRRGQEATDQQVARWIDYSNTVEGVTEGLAVFPFPDGRERRWLTREYGTFGPRRPDELSGTGFTLARGQSLRGRAGILVHRGDAEAGRVAERYREYIGEESR